MRRTASKNNNEYEYGYALITYLPIKKRLWVLNETNDGMWRGKNFEWKNSSSEIVGSDNVLCIGKAR